MNLNATLFFQMIVFFVLGWVTMKFIWPPLTKAIDERRQKIAEGLADAEKGKADLAQAQARVNLIEASAKADLHARMTDAEKQVVIEDMEADRRARTTSASSTVRETIRNPKVWLMVGVYFTMAFLNTNQIWFPTLLKNVGAKSVTEAGNILVGVWIFAAAFTLLVCGNSDRVGERKWHILVTGMMAVAAYLALPLAAGSLWATAVLVAIGAASGYAVFMVFWTIPPVFLEARGAAMGIAMISAVGQFGGLSGPAVVGWAFHETGSIYIGFAVAAAALFLGTLVAVFAIPHTRLRKAAR